MNLSRLAFRCIHSDNCTTLQWMHTDHTPVCPFLSVEDGNSRHLMGINGVSGEQNEIEQKISYLHGQQADLRRSSGCMCRSQNSECHQQNKMQMCYSLLCR